MSIHIQFGGWRDTENAEVKRAEKQANATLSVVESLINLQVSGVECRESIKSLLSSDSLVNGLIASVAEYHEQCEREQARYQAERAAKERAEAEA